MLVGNALSDTSLLMSLQILIPTFILDNVFAPDLWYWYILINTFFTARLEAQDLCHLEHQATMKWMEQASPSLCLNQVSDMFEFCWIKKFGVCTSYTNRKLLPFNSLSNKSTPKDYSLWKIWTVWYWKVQVASV